MNIESKKANLGNARTLLMQSEWLYLMLRFADSHHEGTKVS